MTEAQTATTAIPDATPGPPSESESALDVFRNGAFLRLWLSQAATQIGGNMVLFGLTVIVRDTTTLNTAVSLLILSFLVPAVLFSAVAGVYVDRIDRRLILVATNLLRAIAIVGLYLVGENFLLILLLNFFISTVTVFFAPAEAAMIPQVVPRHQLLAANGIFTLTLNAAFALGFALLGPLVVNVAGPEAVILVVAALYFVGAILCFTLPKSPPPIPEIREGAHPVGETSRAVHSTVAQLREGISFIRSNHAIGWSLLYLSIAASLVGVLGVLGPAFAETTLGLDAKDLAVVVLPLGFGIVMGILLLNQYGKYLPRRRLIEFGLIALGVSLARVVGRGTDQPTAPAGGCGDRADRPLVRHVAAGDRRGHRAAGGHRLCRGRHPVPDPAPGGSARGCPWPRVRRPQHARVGLELPADHHRRPDLRRRRDDRGHARPRVRGHRGRRGELHVPRTSASTVGVTADPHVVDPIAAALGADRPTWHAEPDAPSSPLPGACERAGRRDAAPGPTDPPDRA